jgi:hypothetical protein
MTTFDINGTHFYSQDDSPDTLFYLPSSPSAELDSQGRPTLQIFRLPQYSMLQLGAQFAFTQAEQSAALSYIADHFPAVASARLQPAPVTVQKVALLLANQSGKLVELKSSTSSGYPPYTAVFSIQLAPDQVTNVIAAVDGRSGLLFVEYTIIPPDRVAAALGGALKCLTRRCDVASWFRGTEGITHLHLAQ